MKKLYVELGETLTKLRTSANESLGEVADAVEIEEALMKDIESGHKRPDIEILELLIAHFKITTSDADDLWKLAGYGQEIEGITMADAEDDAKKEIRINIPADNHVMYTDMVQVMSNQYGVVMHFLQMAPNNQASVVSRIGMSKEHAESLLELLKRNLEGNDN